jgi:periplasmic divalent cation tolerance protein
MSEVVRSEVVRSEVVRIEVTCGSTAEAEAIAAALVEQRLAACVHLAPIRSVYRWDGAVHHDDELALTVTTVRRHWSAIERLVTELHSYELPAIVCIDVAAGSRAYLDWVAIETVRRPAPAP